MKTSSLLEKLAEEWNLPALRGQRAVVCWQRSDLRRLARPLYVQGGVLHLAAPNHALASELSFLRNEITSTVREKFGLTEITDVKVHVQPRGQGPPEVAVEPPDRGKIDGALGRLTFVRDPKLRGRLAELWAWAEAWEEAVLGNGGHRCKRCGAAFWGGGEFCPVCTLYGTSDAS